MEKQRQEVKMVVPKLRFSAFRDAAAWKEAKLEELIDTVSPPTKLQSASYRATGRFPIIDQSQDAICGWTDDAQAVVRAPLPLIVFGDHTCALKFVERPFAQGADGIKILSAKPAVTIQFLFHSLNHQPLVMEDYKRHFSALKERQVYFPSVDSGEQRTIADCLSSLDEVIVAQAQKVEALKSQKRGLMHELFPREGKADPRVRFSNKGSWLVSGLPEVTFFQEGPGIMAVDFRSEGVPLIRLAGVGGLEVTLDGCNYLDPIVVAQKWKHFRLVAEDLIISTSATFGLSSRVTDVSAGSVFYTGLIRFRSTDERLTRSYLKVFLESPYFLRQAELAAEGGGIKHFGPTHLKKMEICIPPLAEQVRIADCLASLDAWMAAEDRRLAALKLHKQGLMQQMLPAQGAG